MRDGLDTAARINGATSVEIIQRFCAATNERRFWALA
jgi:hypothetical protein